MKFWHIGQRSHSNVQSILSSLFVFAGWGVLIWCVFVGVGKVPNEIIGGSYSNTDGEWLRWNTEFIFAYGTFMDASPFNAFSGTGSIFPPNLPWLNPGAIALALPADRDLAIQVSYALYALQIGISIVVLSRALGLHWGVGTIAAQLHIVVLFPPFSAFFVPIEWYSSAPIYAQLSMVLNFGTAAFVLIGRSHCVWKNLAWIVTLPILVVIGLFSSPFNFVFLFLPYIFFGLAWLMFSLSDYRELLWKVGALVVVAVVVFSFGFPDYLQAMAGTSARVPSGATNWSNIFSFEAWLVLFGTHELCADPYVLICAENPIAWFQILGLFGAIALLFFSRGPLRSLGIWGIVYTALVHFYDYLASADWLGPLGVLSTRYVSWSSYSLIGICAVAGSWALAAVSANQWIAFRDGVTGKHRQHVTSQPLTPSSPFLIGGYLTEMVKKLGADISSAFAFGNQGMTGVRVLLFTAVLLMTVIVVGLTANIQMLSPGASGQTTANFLQKMFSFWWWTVFVFLGVQMSWHFVRLILRRTKSCLMKSPQFGDFREFGFARHNVSTFLTCIVPLASLVLLPSLGSADAARREPRVGPILDYLFETSSMELGDAFPGYVATVWSPAMDELEPYNQALTNASFRYIGGRLYFDRRYGNTFTETDLTNFAIPTFEEYGQWVTQQSQTFALTLLGSDVARKLPEGRMLRIYEPDFHLMQALGIRFVITDAEQTDELLTLRVEQSEADSQSVFLYELEAPNLATYSPTTTVNIDKSATATLAAVEQFSRELHRVVITDEPIDGPFFPVDEVAINIVRDGYQISASSKGQTLLLLPIQFSNCLQIVNQTDEARLVRANFLQTLLIFDEKTDIVIQNKLGLFGNAKCGLADVEFSNSLL